MSRRADAEKKLVDRIAERTGQEIAAACREEIEAERPSPFPHRGHPSWSAAEPRI